MNLVDRIISRLRRDYYRWRYGLAARRVLKTAPLNAGRFPFLLLSMVHHRDVISYIVAVKSFAHFVNPKRIVVVCDPSINDSDRRIIKSQLPHVEFRDADEFVHPSIPRGGCWERLYAITEYNTENYVVQLDADTVTLQNIDEVSSAITGGYGFVLGEVKDQQLVTFEDASNRACKLLAPNAHIQTRSEAALPHIGLSEANKYVRGCAGFTGFPMSADMRMKMLDFSSRMHQSLGDAWASWGTEQVTSNYLVSNAYGTEVLPFPKYGTPTNENADSAFFHFIGSIRFINKCYENKTKYVVRTLL